MAGTLPRVLLSTHGKTRSDLGQAAVVAAQRLVFRGLRQAGLRRTGAGYTLEGNRGPRSRLAFRAFENPVATTGGGTAAGTRDPGAAGGGSNGAGNPARLRRYSSARQSLFRLERGREAGAAPSAAVAPRRPGSVTRARRKGGRGSRGNPVVGRG